MERDVSARHYYKKRYLFQALIILLIVSCDQLSKYLVRANLTYGQSIPAEGGFFRILYALNDGVAFSMFQGGGTTLIIIQAVLVGLILAALIYMNMRMAPSPPTYCLSLMLSGGVGNLIDRISAGMVTDFIAVGNFPVFNLADSALTVGCFLMIGWVIFSEASAARHAAKSVGAQEPASRQDPES